LKKTVLSNEPFEIIRTLYDFATKYREIKIEKINEKELLITATKKRKQPVEASIFKFKFE
jgi:hypothetical protein